MHALRFYDSDPELPGSPLQDEGQRSAAQSPHANQEQEAIQSEREVADDELDNMLWYYHGKDLKPWDVPCQEILEEFHHLACGPHGRDKHKPAPPLVEPP